MLHYLFLCLISTVVCKNVFVSSPFDNFRIECPKRAAATELAVRMVESVGQKRQDIVFDMSCETVEDLYPWINIPVGVADIEREDCHYSEMIDPILDENTTFTCAPREYLAGITRLSDTRIQTMCCRLRSRDEFNCKDLVFNKPIGLTRSTLIEHDNQLINAIKIEERNYVVRFCDLAPRATASILSDEKVRKSTSAPISNPEIMQVPHDLESEGRVEQLQDKQNTLKTVKTQKSDVSSAKMRIPMHPPRKVEAAPVVEFIESAPPIADIPTDTSDVSEADFEQLPALPSATTRRISTVPLVFSTIPPNVSSTKTTPVQQELPVTEKVTNQEAPSSKEAPIFNQQIVENIVKQIGSATTEEKAAQIFQQSLNMLLQNAHETPIEPIPSQPTGPPAARPPQNLENANFENEQFPQQAGKQRFSKELLPLRKSFDGEESTNLQPVNLEGRRRSPIRTHRPHVDIWDSDEEEENDKTVAEINGSIEMHFETTHPPKKIVKKIIKKVIRAHRSRTTTPSTTVKDSATENIETTTQKIENPISSPTIAITTEVATTKSISNSFFNSMEQETTPSHTERITFGFRPSRGRTTTPSARRDLPVTRKLAETRVNQQDNARFIDEETQLSPFDDPVNEELEELESTTSKPASTPRKKVVEQNPRVEFQEDEDLEDVISKLSARRGDIRRAPVRNIFAEAQFAEKAVLPKKDGVRTHIPQNGLPLALNMMESISMKNLDGFDTASENSREEDAGSNQNQKLEQHKDGDEEETGEISTGEIENQVSVTFPTRSTTTVYDPNTFYRTPRPRPAKKESILRFCSKESAMRDQSNMVIACGLDQDIWTPSRCPENADCFPSHDSLYRICCPVHRSILKTNP